jgi:hypothetical protein
VRAGPENDKALRDTPEGHAHSNRLSAGGRYGAAGGTFRDGTGTPAGGVAGVTTE